MKDRPAPGIGQVNNRLLAMLAQADFSRIKPFLERVELPQGQSLHKPNEKIDYVYFPERGMVSLVHPLMDGAQIEVGVVGKEGLVGVPILLGADQWTVEAMVQMEGTALRLPATVLRDLTRRNAPFREYLLRYAQALLAHIAQSAACNVRHRLDQRLARWLLTARDRSNGDELPLSHEFLSMMLGIRRAGVTVAVAKFKAAGFTSNRHGKITILDRRGLEKATCECYRAVKAETDRLLR